MHGVGIYLPYLGTLFNVGFWRACTPPTLCPTKTTTHQPIHHPPSREWGGKKHRSDRQLVQYTVFWPTYRPCKTSYCKNTVLASKHGNLAPLHCVFCNAVFSSSTKWCFLTQVQYNIVFFDTLSITFKKLNTNARDCLAFLPAFNREYRQLRAPALTYT